MQNILSIGVPTYISNWYILVHIVGTYWCILVHIVGTYWCILVYIGVHNGTNWCILVHIGAYWYILVVHTNQALVFKWAVYFRLFYKHALKKFQQINVKKCPFSTQYWVSNPQPTEYESTPTTTRPGLPPK